MNDLFDIKGKTALITGAGGLLGEQHALALASAGADLILIDIHTDQCERLRDRVKHMSVKTTVAKCDVASESEWRSLREILVDNPVDILVNNAAYTNKSKTHAFEKDFFESPISDFDDIMKVNLRGTYLGCKIVGESMVNRGSGSIINMGSLYGVVSPTHRIYEGTSICQPVGYSVSKAAVLGLTRFLAGLWAKHNVRVNAITPGGIFDDHKDPFLSKFNEIVPMQRMAHKEELQGVTLFLASNASSYCTGQNIIIDGGWTVI